MNRRNFFRWFGAAAAVPLVAKAAERLEVAPAVAKAMEPPALAPRTAVTPILSSAVLPIEDYGRTFEIRDIASTYAPEPFRPESTRTYLYTNAASTFSW